MEEDPNIFKEVNETIVVPRLTMEVNPNGSKDDLHVRIQRVTQEVPPNSNLEINNVESYNSSDELEFVKTTQVDVHDGIMEENQLSNKDFLKNSWENLADLNEEGIQPEVDPDPDAEFLDFQLAMTKTQNKKPRQKNKAINVYSTRSITGSQQSSQ